MTLKLPCAQGLWRLVVAAVLCLTVFCGCQPENVQKLEPGSAQPVNFRYDGRLYSHDGHVVYALPDGLTLLGETNNVGNTFPLEHDFDCNEDGFVYADPDNIQVIYFQWEQWDELTDGGKEPYLILNRKE